MPQNTLLSLQLSNLSSSHAAGCVVCDQQALLRLRSQQNANEDTRPSSLLLLIDFKDREEMTAHREREREHSVVIFIYGICLGNGALAFLCL